VVIIHITPSQTRNWKITLPRFDKFKKFSIFCEVENAPRHTEDIAQRDKDSAQRADDGG